MTGRAVACALALMSVLAGSAGAATRDQFVLRFDLLSPDDLTCDVDAPGSRVRNGRDLTGRPMIYIFGDARAASITCTGADGTRWLATANRTAPYTPAEATYGMVLYRPDQAATMTLIELGNRTEYQHKTFVRVDRGNP